MQLSSEAFEELVAAEVARIPGPVLEKLENVAFLVRDDVSPEQREELGLDDEDDLLGLFEGLTRGEERNAGSHLPPTITLFRLPILDMAEDRAALLQEIRDTLWHEVAHYLGLDEDDVRHEEAKSDAKRSA